MDEMCFSFFNQVALLLKAVSIIYNNYFSYETGENEVSEGKGNI